MQVEHRLPVSTCDGLDFVQECLRTNDNVPSYAEYRPVESPEEEVERQLLRREEAAPYGSAARHDYFSQVSIIIGCYVLYQARSINRNPKSVGRSTVIRGY